jgi:hypothetical protein
METVPRSIFGADFDYAVLDTEDRRKYRLWYMKQLLDALRDLKEEEKDANEEMLTTATKKNYKKWEKTVKNLYKGREYLLKAVKKGKYTEPKPKERGVNGYWREMVKESEAKRKEARKKGAIQSTGKNTTNRSDDDDDEANGEGLLVSTAAKVEVGSPLQASARSYAGVLRISGSAATAVPPNKRRRYSEAADEDKNRKRVRVEGRPKKSMRKRGANHE